MLRPLLLLFVVVACGLLPARADDLASRVVILANSDDPESLKLANYYALKRDVPVENIIALKLPAAEAISWTDFVQTLFNPLQAELVKRGWIDAIGMNLADPVGRKKYAISGHKISYLVVCRGTPLKVVNDPALLPEKTPVSSNPAFQTNAAAVDSELALLAMSNPPLIAFVPNPLFRKEAPSDTERMQIVKVSRLDGPSLDDCKRLVDQALEAEQTGLAGRSYIDIGGPHALGDRWLGEAAKQLEELGFDGDVDRAAGSLQPWVRFDAPVLYFGWYAGDINGPFAQLGFVFPPGAVALHIHSYSADTVRSTTRGWVGPLVARGVTATFGNVTEPYLELTHQPQLILQALARGDTLGDAAAYSVPGYSWQAMVIGDPLYRPFKVSFDAQWERREKLDPHMRTYVVLRRMRQLERAGGRTEAIWIGQQAQKTNPSLATMLATVDLQRADGDVDGARQTLEWLAGRRSFTFAEAPLAVIAAQRLVDLGAPKQAVDVWQRVLVSRALSKEVRVEWLRQAQDTARAAGDPRQAARWAEELQPLTASPPETPVAP